MQEVSGTGIRVKIIALPTFPVGIDCTAFADDADPLDTPEIQIAEWGMGVNGDMVIWRAPKPIEVMLNLIPNTEEDKNLAILFDSNRVAKNKVSTKDNITMVVTYPDGTVKTLTNGAIVQAMPLNSIASNAKTKSRPYRFVFENKLN
jgi:hypothetical protein